MAMENKRIIQLSTERTTLTSGDYVMVDNEDDGSAKYRLDRLKETDTTLSVSGKAADAAATGQAISDEATAREAADTALGEDIDDLKSALDDITTSEIIKSANMLDINAMTQGKYMWNNVEYASSGYWHTDFVPVEAEKTYSFQAQTSSDIASRRNQSMRFVCEYDANKTYLRSKENTGASNGYTAPNDVAYIIASIESAYFTNASTTKPAFVEGLNVIPYEDYVTPHVEYAPKAVLYHEAQNLTEEEKATARNNIGVYSDSLVNVTTLETIPFTWTDGYYMNASGIPVASASYSYSNKVAVNTGDKIVGRLRMLTAYSDESTTIYGQFKENITEYIVPDAVKYIVISVETSIKDRNVSKINITQKTKNEINSDILLKARKGINSIRLSGQLDSSHEMIAKTNLLRKGKTISFYGKITSFDYLEIGCGELAYSNGAGIKITSSDIEYYNAGSLYASYSHGLTMSGFISVVISVDGVTNKPTFTLSTANGNYSVSPPTVWNGADANIIVKAPTSVITDCKLSYYGDDVKRSIWYIGDSYMSPGDQSRIPAWLINANAYKSICSIGYSGASALDVMTTINALNSENCFPSYLIWGIGMNNADSSSAINGVWKSFTDALIDVCDSHDVEIILCTIPNTPSVNNKFKNEYIRNSGKRYVDYASAVNTSIDGTEWISGTLSSDNVHPTAEGAKILASKFMADFPEVF